MPCPPLTKNLLSRIFTLGFYVIEQPGCGFITQSVTQQKSWLALVTGIQLVNAHWSLVMQVVLAPPLPVWTALKSAVASRFKVMHP